MSISFVHFQDSKTNLSNTAAGLSSGTTTEKTLYRLHNLYLNTLHLQTNEPCDASIAKQYSQILRNPLMQQGVSSTMRDLRLDLREACCWGLACYHESREMASHQERTRHHIEGRDASAASSSLPPSPHALSLAWLLKNLSSRIHLWRHPNCVKVLNAVVRLAWRNQWYHRVRWACETLMLMACGENGEVSEGSTSTGAEDDSTAPRSAFSSEDHSTSAVLINDCLKRGPLSAGNLVGNSTPSPPLMDLVTFCIYIQTLYIIGEWSLMASTLREYERTFVTDTMKNNAMSIQPLNSFHFHTQNQQHLGSSDSDSIHTEELSYATMKKLMRLHSPEGTDMSLHYHICSHIESHLPKHLCARRQQWCNHLSEKAKKREKLPSDASNKPLRIQIAVPQHESEDAAADYLSYLAEALHNRYKKLFDSSNLSNNRVVQIAVSYQTNAFLQVMIDQKQRLSRYRNDGNYYQFTSVATGLEGKQVFFSSGKRKRDQTDLKKDNHHPKKRIHSNTDISIQDFYENLKDCFAETHEGPSKETNTDSTSIASTPISSVSIHTVSTDIFEKGILAGKEGTASKLSPASASSSTPKTIDPSPLVNESSANIQPAARSTLTTATGSNPSTKHKSSLYANKQALTDTVNQLNAQHRGILDTMHLFLELLITKYYSLDWSARLISAVRLMAKNLHIRHQYAFSSTVSLHLAELMMDQYSRFSEENSSMVQYKVLAHKLLSGCEYESTFNSKHSQPAPEDLNTHKMRILFLYGTIAARSNPSDAITFYSECHHLLSQEPHPQVLVRCHVNENSVTLFSLQALISELQQRLVIFDAEARLSKGDFIEGAQILERHIDVIQGDDSISGETTALVRDLLWWAVLGMESSELHELGAAVPNILTFLFTHTQPAILANFHHARTVFRKLWSFLQIAPSHEAPSVNFSPSQRTNLLHNLLSMLQGAFEDFYLSKSRQFKILAEIALYGVFSCRKIGRFYGSSIVEQYTNNLNCLVQLLRVFVEKIRIPRTQYFLDKMIEEFFDIFMFADEKITVIDSQTQEEPTESTDQAENEVKQHAAERQKWKHIQDESKWSAAACFYALYGITVIDPQEKSFLEWKRRLEYIKHSGPSAKLNESTAKIAFFILEDFARQQLEFDLNPSRQQDIYGVLSAIFPCVFKFVSPHEKKIADVETSTLPWNDDSIIEKVPQGDLVTIIPNELDRRFQKSFNLLLAKSQMRYAEYGPEEEKFSRLNEAINIARISLGLTPRDDSAWILLGEIYSLLVVLHLDEKLKQNEDLIITEALRTNLLLPKEESSFNSDLEVCLSRSLRCFHIALQLNPASTQAYYSIAEVLYPIIVREICPSIFPEMNSLWNKCYRYSQQAMRLANEGEPSRLRYMAVYLYAKVCSESISPKYANYQHLVPIYKGAHTLCLSYLNDLTDLSEQELVKKDLAEILLHWTQSVSNPLNNMFVQHVDNIQDGVKFLLSSVYRHPPEMDLVEASNVGYLQGYAIPASYADIERSNASKHRSTSAIILWNILYQSFYECLRIDPHNYNAVYNLAMIVYNKHGPWRNYTVAQKILWSLFKPKSTGKTNRPDLFIFTIRNRHGTSDYMSEKKVLSLILRMLAHTKDTRILSMILAGIRRSYISHGTSMVNMYVRGIILLLNCVKDRLNKEKEDSSQKGKKKKKKKVSKSEKEQLFKQISMAYLYVRDQEVDKYAADSPQRKEALALSEQLLFAVKTEYKIAIPLEKDSDNTQKLIDYHRKKGLNLTRRTRVAHRGARKSKTSKMLSSDIQQVHLKSFQERIQEQDQKSDVDGEELGEEEFYFNDEGDMGDFLVEEEGEEDDDIDLSDEEMEDDIEEEEADLPDKFSKFENYLGE